ncbi:14370_t:CDS:2, partial [Entrophospora sp. SA101]
QLEASNGDCSAIFLVGGFSESLYLKKRIKEEFKKKQYVSIVSVPSEPACAIVRGAVEYGLNKDVIKNRVLKYNYGIVVKKPWTCEFPVARREECGNVRLMRWMATKGQQVKVGQKFSTYFRMSHEYQTHVIVDLYISDNITTYSDEPGVYKLGKFTVEVPDVHLGKNRRTEYELCFDQDEITATTKTHNASESVSPLGLSDCIGENLDELKFAFAAATLVIIDDEDDGPIGDVPIGDVGDICSPFSCEIA